MNADTMKGLIDGLLLALEEGQRYGVVLSPEAMEDYHAALTALVAERDALRQQRDEARREWCYMESYVRNECSMEPTDLPSIAAERGWDCFAEKEGGGA